MSYRLSDHREKFKNAPGPATGWTRVSCRECGQTIGADSEECPFCGFIFKGGCARDYAEEADGKLLYKARRRHLFHVIVVILLILGMGGLSVIGLLLFFR